MKMIMMNEVFWGWHFILTLLILQVLVIRKFILTQVSLLLVLPILPQTLRLPASTTRVSLQNGQLPLVMQT